MARRELGLGRLVDALPCGRQHRHPDLPHGVDLAPRSRSASHRATRLHHSHRPARGGDDLHQHPAHALPSVWHLLGAFAVVVFLVWAAKKYAGVLWSRLPCRKAPASPRVYALAGFAFLMGSFLLYGGGPSFGLTPIITVLEI